MHWHSNEVTAGSNPNGLLFFFFILTNISFYSVLFALLKVIFMIFFSVINAFHNPVNYSSVKLCVLIKTKTVINTRKCTRPICCFAQFILLNIMPKFALDLLWIHISVLDQWLNIHISVPNQWLNKYL